MSWSLGPEFHVVAPAPRGEPDGAEMAALIPHLDLTTLEADDTPERVRKLCELAMHPGPGLPACAAVCVYPALVPVAAQVLRGTGVGIASVAGGFPAGQIPISLKVAEAAWAVAAGATEIDMVINRGAFLSGDYDVVFAEVAETRRATGDALLKVILETGELPGPAAWKLVAEIALAAGADMVKTSTGKGRAGATPEAAMVLCGAAAASGLASGLPRGFKAAGGVRTPEQAWAYRTMVADVLGAAAATDTRRFRIGASTLLGAILDKIRLTQVSYE